MNNKEDTEIIKFDILEATSFGMCTFVGFIISEYPSSDGNCFGLNVSESNHFNIINFNMENLQELIKRNVVEFPIKIVRITNEDAIIIDQRIPVEWYSKNICNICASSKAKENLKLFKNFLKKLIK